MPVRAAVADRTAYKLPKSPLTNISIRHDRAFVRACDLVLGSITLFLAARRSQAVGGRSTRFKVPRARGPLFGGGLQTTPLGRP